MKYTMLDWLMGRRAPAYRQREADPVPVKPQGRAMSGTYLLLYRYLENRYANTVVLTFAQIEDLLGFALPAQARLHKTWWTDPQTDVPRPHYSDSWILASRTATPNLLAETVVFERAGVT